MPFYKDFSNKRTSNIWQHFLRSENEQTAQCKVIDCLKILKIGGGSTKGLHTHLLSVHNIRVTNQPGSAKANSLLEDHLKKKTKAITDYVSVLECPEKSLEVTLARLTALDGITFNVLSSSLDLRAGLHAMGFKNLPSSANTVRKIVIEYSHKLRNFIINEMLKKINGLLLGKGFLYLLMNGLR